MRAIDVLKEKKKRYTITPLSLVGYYLTNCCVLFVLFVHRILNQRAGYLVYQGLTNRRSNLI